MKRKLGMFVSIIAILIPVVLSNASAAWDNLPKLKIAVYEFETDKDSGLNPALISDSLAGELQKRNECVILERSLIKKILDEKTLEMSGVTESDASKIGAMIGADKIISGSLSKMKDRWVLTIKGIDVKSGKLELYDQLTGLAPDDILSVMPIAADRVMRLAKGEKCEPFDAKNRLLRDDSKDMPADKLVLHLPMDGNARDLSPSKNNGTAIGMTLVADRFGREKKAYHFSAQIAYIALSQKQKVTGPFSIAVWIKTESMKGGRIAGLGNTIDGMSGTRDKQIYMHASGRVLFGMMPANGKPVAIHSNETFNDGQWHFITGVFSEGKMTLYIDAESAAVSQEPVIPLHVEGYWRVGYDIMNMWPGEPTMYTLDGDVDDLRIYARQLTITEIKQLYHQNGYGK
jgi:hypothetical protein